MKRVIIGSDLKTFRVTFLSIRDDRQAPIFRDVQAINRQQAAELAKKQVTNVKQYKVIGIEEL